MPQASNCLISVVIPVYNQSEFVLDAIESVQSQTINNWELIIVNDGSTDSLAKTLDSCSLNFRYFEQDNKGAASARNVGISHARGKYIAFLDADDRWPSTRLHDLLCVFEENRQVSIVLGQVEEKGKVSWIPSFGAALIDKLVFERVGLIDTHLLYSEDQDWFLRVKESDETIILLSKVTLIRRFHLRSATHNKCWKEVGIHSVLKRSLDRRRRMQNGVAANLIKLSNYRIQE